MKIELRELSKYDGIEVYNMLQEIAMDSYYNMQKS